MKKLLTLWLFTASILASGCDRGSAECPEKDTVCGERCVDTSLDPFNCGGCGNTCATGFVCSDGSCACTNGESVCGDRCVKLASDSSNCGSCENACSAGDICVNGSCTQGGCSHTDCQGVCIDTTSDEQNCGACGKTCGAGLQCLGGVCVGGDLYAACFSEDVVAPFIKGTGTKTGPSFAGVDGPQSLAFLPPNHLLVVGSLDDTLFVVDRATMQTVGSLILGPGSCASQILVRGSKAYVVKSCVNTVEVIDLSDPTTPLTVDEVSTGEGTNPFAAAFDSEGTLWVSLWLTTDVVPIDFAGEKGIAGARVTLPAAEGTPYPAGVAVVGNTVYVTLNNLGVEYLPAGNGRIVTVERGSMTANSTLIDLGKTCKNPGLIVTDGRKVFVACTGSYDDSGEIVTLDTSTGEITRVHTGGAPSRLSLDSSTGVLYASNSTGIDFFAISDGNVTKVAACTASPSEFVADVLVVP